MIASVRRFRWLLWVCLTLLGVGCAGYRMGPTNDQIPGGRSIQINPVQNATLEPRVGPAVSQALRKEIQRDGTLHLSTSGDANIIVSTTITRYHRTEMAYNPGDTRTATDYMITLQARVVARERITGKELVNREVAGRYTLLVGNDLASAERQGLPSLAEDLARNITTLLTEGEW